MTQQEEGLKQVQVRQAVIGQNTVIKRALPSREKRMIGAWCFLDHAGPVVFNQGDGLDVGPHPHIGLQTFTWMLEGTVMHADSLGSQQLICNKQVNLMTAGRGISHTEVAPSTETKMHTAQLWIALPDEKRHMPPQFEHYPDLPIVEQNHLLTTVLVGEYQGETSPVEVYTPLIGLDIEALQDTTTTLTLNPEFEYGVLVLEGDAVVNGHALDQEHLLLVATGHHDFTLSLKKGHRILLIGGTPFESDIILWWNFVARTTEEIHEAAQQWHDQDARFGEVTGYDGPRLSAPPLPEKLKASR